MIDINYLIHVLNKNGNKLERVQKFKPYEPLTEDIKIRTRDMNAKYVYDKTCSEKTYKYRYFEKYATSIIKSATGTGKKQPQ